MLSTLLPQGFPDISVGKECRRPGFNSWVRKTCWRRDRLPTPVFLGFPCGSAGKESACNVRDLASIPELGRPLEKGKATHSSTLACIVHGIAESDTIEQLSLSLYFVTPWTAACQTSMSFIIFWSLLIIHVH